MSKLATIKITFKNGNFEVINCFSVHTNWIEKDQQYMAFKQVYGWRLILIDDMLEFEFLD